MASSFETEAMRVIASDEAIRPPTAAEARRKKEAAWAVPGTDRAAEIAKSNAQQGVVSDFADGFGTTALSGLIRTATDETPGLRQDLSSLKEQAYEEGNFLKAAVGELATAVGAPTALSLIGARQDEPDYDKDKEYEALTKGIPYEYHDDIMEYDGLGAAQRARERVLTDLQRGQRMAQQDSGGLAILAGSLFDVDAPLTLFSGGAYGTAKLTGKALKAARMARLSPKLGLRVAGAVQGANAGLQAGAVVAAVDAANRETVGWEDIANMAFSSMLLGSAVGGVVKGDVRTSVLEAQKEFHRRLATNDPAMNQPLVFENMAGDNLENHRPPAPFVEEVGGESGVGAAQVTPNMRMPQATYPHGSNFSPTDSEIIGLAEAWRHDTGWNDRKLSDDDTWWGKVAGSKAMNLVTGDFRSLYRSNSAVANYIAGTVFESVNGLGRGRATAAIRMDNYHRRVQSHLGTNVLWQQQEWARKNGMTWQGTGYHASQDGQRAFNREVMLELNNRRMGRTGSQDTHVAKAADHYEAAGKESLNVLRGRDGETAVDGFDAVPDSRGYTPYRWDGARIRQLEQSGVISRKDLEASMARAYSQAGIGAGKDALAVAKAVIHRALSKDAGMDSSMMSMLSGDGKNFMREAMVLGGVKEADADAIIGRLVGKQHNQSKESFAKTRNDIDMGGTIDTLDGSTLNIVDLFDQDLHGVWQRYSRQVSGSGALARSGITNRAKRTEMITAMRAEQLALGETPLDAGLLEAMFSHFNAGPIHGYGLRGGTNEGIGHAALVKRIANLGLLEKLGVTQIAETGAQIAQNGVMNWLTRGPGAWIDKELKAGNKRVLDDLAFMTGEIGNDHWAFASWLDLDDVSPNDKADWLHTVGKYTGSASFIQGYTSAFNAVRGFQQQTAALGATDKILRTVKDYMDGGKTLDDDVFRRIENDFGLFPEDIQSLKQLIEDGVIEFKTRGNNTFVNRLNMDQWGAEAGEAFAAAITRNVNQVVQKSMAGEQDAWMSTVLGSMLLHLKTFPLAALQKQILRNTKVLDKQAVTTVMYGLATAAVAVKLRDVIDGNDRSVGETAKQAFNYSNMTGFLPMIYDPVMTLVGLDGARINPYGPVYDWTPPTVRMANDMLRIPGAVANTAVGTADWHDQQAIKAIPFAGTYGISRMFD